MTEDYDITINHLQHLSFLLELPFHKNGILAILMFTTVQFQVFLGQETFNEINQINCRKCGIFFWLRNFVGVDSVNL